MPMCGCLAGREGGQVEAVTVACSQGPKWVSIWARTAHEGAEMPDEPAAKDCVYSMLKFVMP